MIYLINEHHEMYLIMRMFLNSQQGKKLILVDEHHDMASAVVRLDDLNRCMESSIREVVYNQLRTSDYILPLIYLECFESVTWISNGEDISEQVQTGRYFSISAEESCDGFSILQLSSKKNDSGAFKYSVNNLESAYCDSESDNNRGCVLSIDLDFFSCDNRLAEKIELEITQSEYMQLVNNKYHKLRLHYGSRIRFIEKNSRYYLIIQEHDGPNIDKRSNKYEITLKIAKLQKYLSINEIIPTTIIISRSNYSGFTPLDQFEFIERGVVNMLKKMYDCDVIFDVTVGRC